MAGAPYKKGLGYFSHDTDHEQNLEYLEAETGLIGYAVYFKILELAYKYEGYYLKFDERQRKLLSSRWNLNYDEFMKIIDVCLNEELFDKTLFLTHNILTSSGIQKRYLRGCDRRKRVELINVYMLLNNNSINDNINSDNVSIIPINESNNGINVAESKVKESKINENKLNRENVIPEFSQFLSYAKEHEPNINEHNLKLKYESWKVNGWKTGKGKPIENWKSTLLNTIQYIDKNDNGNISNKKPDFRDQKKEFVL